MKLLMVKKEYGDPSTNILNLYNLYILTLVDVWSYYMFMVDDRK